MSILLSHPTQIIKGEIHLSSSKSESNRALIIQALCKNNIDINNLSKSDDTIVLQQLLNSHEFELDVNMAGTAIRFLTAFKALEKGKCMITGSVRMKERPIKILVDVLKQLGADIDYVEKEGFPPLKIVGKELEGGKIKIDGRVSSQFISALLMIAPKLQNGIQIEFIGEIISRPYIEMTIVMMEHFGVSVKWEGNSIIVRPGDYKSKNISIEADWSSASYWYSMVALSKEADVTLLGLKRKSLQGDSVVRNIYENFGVITEFMDKGIRLIKDSEFKLDDSPLEFDFIDCPDIAQTVAVTCAALNVPAKLTGLKTLRIKETDRISALQSELTKLGFSVEVANDDILISQSLKNNGSWGEAEMIQIKTYNDHRMAMAFAPLVLINSISIEDKNVVTKSYPKYWEDLKVVGVLANFQN